jgi:hypothetical protein
MTKATKDAVGRRTDAIAKDPAHIRREVEAILSHPTCTVSEFRQKIFPGSKNSAYAAIQRGEIQVVRCGRSIRVVTAPWRRIYVEGAPK